MSLQENGTIRIVENIQGSYRVAVKGLNGQQYNVMPRGGNLALAVQVAASKAAFNGFRVLAYHAEPIAYWCRYQDLGQYRIIAHDIVHARELAVAKQLDPTDVATTPYDLPTLKGILKWNKKQ